MIKLICLFALMPIILFAQNAEPTQKKFIVPVISQDSVYLSGDLPYFRQDKFIKGTHWSDHKVLLKTLNHNQMDIYQYQDTSSLLDSSLLFVKLDNIWTHCQGASIINARGIQYSPILEINTNLTHKVQTVSSSSRNPIFGFQTIRGTKDTTNDCLIVDSTISNGTVILEEPWTADQFSSKSVS